MRTPHTIYLLQLKVVLNVHINYLAYMQEWTFSKSLRNLRKN